MFEPISALVASSCSKKGIRDVSIDIICFGETSICVTSLTYDKVGSLFCLEEILVLVKLPKSSVTVFASAIVKTFSASASKYSNLEPKKPLTSISFTFNFSLIDLASFSVIYSFSFTITFQSSQIISDKAILFIADFQSFLTK